MAFNRTFNRTVVQIADGLPYNTTQHDKTYADMGTIQTDITAIETETDGLDTSLATANTNITALQNDLNWEANYVPYNSSFTCNTAGWNDACNISGEGWISGLIISNWNDTFSSYNMSLDLAINVDGTDIKTTAAPLSCTRTSASHPAATSSFDYCSVTVAVPLVIHFDTSCRIQAKSGLLNPTYRNISYWL